MAFPEVCLETSESVAPSHQQTPDRLDVALVAEAPDQGIVPKRLAGEMLVGGRFAAPHEAGSVHKLPVSRLLQYYRRPKYQLARDAQLRKGFGQLLDAHRNENGGGQPKRLKGFIQAFIQAGPSGPTLDELEGIFKDTKKPRARVSETVTWVNNKLHELGVSLSIESETVYRVRHKPRH